MEEKSVSIPKVVDMNDEKSLTINHIDCSSSAVSKCRIMNDQLTTFLQILFSKPNYDWIGDIPSLTLGNITDDLQEILSTKLSEQAWMIGDGLKVLSEDISKERSYFSRALKFPFYQAYWLPMQPKHTTTTIQSM